MGNWINIETELPKHGSYFIGCMKGSKHVEPMIREYNGRVYRLTDHYLSESLEITHWMPLPEPPKQ